MQPILERDSPALASVARLAMALEDGVMITDLAGRIVFVNAAFERLTGYSSAEALGQIPALLEDSADACPVSTQVRQTITAGNEWRGSVINVHRSGEEYCAALTISPILTEASRTTHYVGVLRAAHDAARSDGQSHPRLQLETLGLLSAGVFHDLNNYFSVILSYAACLRQGLPAGSQEMRDVDGIVEATYDAAALAAQLLARRQPRPFGPEPLHLGRFVRNSVSTLSRLLPESVAIVIREDEGPQTVLLDPSELEKVLLNLAARARDAMDGPGTLLIQTSRTSLDGDHGPALRGKLPPGSYVTLSVSDTGQARTEVAHGRSSKRFLTTRHAAQGQSLEIIQASVERTGGCLDLREGPGPGSTAVVAWPELEERASSLEQPSALTPDGRPRSVLVVEDNTRLRELIERLLTQAGYSVQTCADGLEAFLAYQHQDRPPDLLLTDVIMPGMDGPELGDRLRAAHPALRVLYISGHLPDQLDDHPVAGKKLLRKPFTKPQLLAAVSAALGG